MIETPVQSVEQWLRRLSERLIRHRLHRNLTQRELARAAGISLRTLARLENGEPVQFESFLRILIALGLEEGLARLVRDAPDIPMEQSKRSGSRRRRASGRRKPREAPREPWTRSDGC